MGDIIEEATAFMAASYGVKSVVTSNMSEQSFALRDWLQTGSDVTYRTQKRIRSNRAENQNIRPQHSNNVGGSYHMEQKGLEKSLAWMESVDVGTLVTDRHIGINKMIREDHPTIKHLFDIWHVAKSVKKKLQHLSQRKGCQVLKPWVGSIINHLYWAVVSSPDDNRRLAVDKWKSVVSHICNKHEGFQGQFPRCEHGPLEGRGQEKAWLTATVTRALMDGHLAQEPNSGNETEIGTKHDSFKE
ncbi:ATP-dependent DNA helicase chl1 [Branchiostoma belcheri]|nr:ATP-dependent DNA helicase chl1 [Branchiostoma belcheri]